MRHAVIGGGIAGATAAEHLANRGGNVTLITDEDTPLYNRILLKSHLKGRIPRDVVHIHDTDWYRERGIDLRLNTRATAVDTDAKRVRTDSGAVDYDRLLVATGGNPRTFPADDGYDNVHYLWDLDHTDRIRAAVQEADRAVVIGGGFLGIDLAVVCAENGLDTTYLIREEHWWADGLDPVGGRIVHGMLEDKGVDIRTRTTAEAFEATDGNVSAVRDDQGETHHCDIVCVAIGQTPNAGFIDVAKEDGALVVDEHLQTSDPYVYAAGNTVRFHSPIYGRRVSRGSWDHAQAMGERAAKNMAGEQEPFTYVSTYGVGHFTAPIQGTGDWTGDRLSRQYDETAYRTLFFRDDRLVGAATIGTGQPLDLFRTLIREQTPINDKEELLVPDPEPLER